MRFSKWHAHGNSYLVVERSEVARALHGDEAHRLCDVRTGIGADGVLEIVEAAERHATIVIWNPDGSPAEFSGNGTRLAAAWLLRGGGDEATIETGGRSYHAKRLGPLFELELGAIDVGAPETLELAAGPVELTPVSVGNPHAVIRGDGGRSELLRLGPVVEVHERFPERVNVQLVRVEGLHTLDVLVWERGAGETSASGSSAAAAAAAAIANGWCESPVTVRMPGGELLVAIDGDRRGTLTGPAEQICTGDVVL